MARKRGSKAAKIRGMLENDPDRAASEIAEAAGALLSQVYSVRSKMRIVEKAVKPRKTRQGPQPATTEDLLQSNQAKITSTPLELKGFGSPGTPGFKVSLKQLTDDLRTIRTMGKDRVGLVLGLLSLFEDTRPVKKETSK